MFDITAKYVCITTTKKKHYNFVYKKVRIIDIHRSNLFTLTPPTGLTT